MATAQQPSVDNIVLRALDTVARAKCPQGFRIDREDKNNFIDVITKERIEISAQRTIPLSESVVNNDISHEFQLPGQRVAQGDLRVSFEGGVGVRGQLLSPPNFAIGEISGELDADISAVANEVWREDPLCTPPGVRMHLQGNHIHISHNIRLTVQANYPIRVYPRGPVHVGAGVGGGVGGVVGGAAGVGGGVAAGAVIGSVVPVAGTIIGGIIGGIVGGIGGAVAGAAAGSGVGAGGGAIRSNIEYHKVYPREVFQWLPQFSHDEHNNVVQCTVLVSTVCSSSHCNLTVANGTQQNDAD